MKSKRNFRLERDASYLPMTSSIAAMIEVPRKCLLEAREISFQYGLGKDFRIERDSDTLLERELHPDKLSKELDYTAPGFTYLNLSDIHLDERMQPVAYCQCPVIKENGTT